MANNSVLNSYAPQFQVWQVNVLGPKPTADMLEQIHGLGLRPGKQALAIAMSLRECGVTGKQIVIACGAPQLNRMRGLIAEGLLKRHAVPSNGEGHTVYKNTVTPKGAAEIKRIAKVMANSTAATEKPKAALKVSRKANKVGVAAVAAAVAEPAKAKPAPAVTAQPATAMPDLPASLQR